MACAFLKRKQVEVDLRKWGDWGWDWEDQRERKIWSGCIVSENSIFSIILIVTAIIIIITITPFNTVLAMSP